MPLGDAGSLRQALVGRRLSFPQVSIIDTMVARRLSSAVSVLLLGAGPRWPTLMPHITRWVSPPPPLVTGIIAEVCSPSQAAAEVGSRPVLRNMIRPLHSYVGGDDARDGRDQRVVVQLC